MLQEGKILGRGESLLIPSLRKLRLLSNPKLCKPQYMHQRKPYLTKTAIFVKTLTLAHKGRWCFPRVDPCSDEHHFLFSAWTQVLCSRRGWQGTKGERERKILKPGPTCRNKGSLIFKLYPFIKIGHTL